MKLLLLLLALNCSAAVKEVRFSVGMLSVNPVPALSLPDLGPHIIAIDWPPPQSLDADFLERMMPDILTDSEFIGAMLDIKPLLPAMVEWGNIASSFEVYGPFTEPQSVMIASHSRFPGFKQWVLRLKGKSVAEILSSLDGK